MLLGSGNRRQATYLSITAAPARKALESVAQRVRNAFCSHRREDVSAPISIIAEADAEDTPLSAAGARVDDQVGGPSYSQVSFVSLPDPRKMWLVL